MKIKKEIKDKELFKDLAPLLDWVSTRSPRQVYEYQEMILNILRLVLDSNFRQDIRLLRKELNVPEKWRTTSYEGKYDEWIDWLDDDKPFTSDHYVVVDLCSKYKLDPKRYIDFLRDYLYFGDSAPYRPMEDIVSKDEFKHKAKIEIDTSSKGVASINFYKDTTQNGLIEFIEKNWVLISSVQKKLEKYPLNRVRKEQIIKRDLEIIILSLMEYNTSKIAGALSKNYANINDLPDNFIPSDSNIRKTISDLSKSISISSGL